jgi:large subunit ribosomal protein L15
MRIEELRPAKGSRKENRRVGRGVGSGLGKTSGKGHKGQKARSGGAKGKGAGFEGGQMPLQRRLPKRGFKNYPFSKEYAVVNLHDLSRIDDLEVITADALYEKGMIKNIRDGLKILGDGEIRKALTVKANAFSATALKKIAAVGGKAEVV